MKILLIFLLLTWNKCFSQSDLETCSISYDKAIKEYLSNKDSIEFINNLSTSKNNWKQCLITKVIPNLNLKTSKEDIITLDSGKNTIFVLQFWASWCPPCMAEIPMMNKLVKEFINENVVFITLAYNQNVATENLIKFKTKFIPNASEISKKLGVLAYPTIYVTSKRNRILNVYLGAEKDNIEKLYFDIKNNILCELKK
jgi:thiol-disulfide isomerase/thioredoxin